MSEINSMYFESLKEAMKFVNALCENSLADERLYNEIKITAEDGAFLVRWVQNPYSGEYGGHFEYVPEDGYVMIEKEMPDGTYQYFHDEEDYREGLGVWLKDNPGWKQSEYGHWYNEEDNARIKADLGIKD